jgi:hypothetical protein
VEGLRHQVFVTDTPRPAAPVQLLELRHRSHARVEDRIRTGVRHEAPNDRVEVRDLRR